MTLSEKIKEIEKEIKSLDAQKMFGSKERKMSIKQEIVHLTIKLNKLQKQLQND